MRVDVEVIILVEQNVAKARQQKVYSMLVVPRRSDTKRLVQRP